MPGTLSDQLQIVAAAVTPVVMVSATAILISGVNARHISISDRIRALAREFRGHDLDTARRRTIRLEVAIFQRRLHLVSWAARMLYAAVFCFIADAIFISGSPLQLQAATLPIFLLGLLLIAIAIVLQLIELSESNATIDLESADLLAAETKD